MSVTPSFNTGPGLLNTGVGRVPYMTATKKLFLTPYYNNTGAKNRFIITPSGTVACTATSATLTGTGTLFLSQLTIGDIVVIKGNTQIFQVLSIASNTSLTATAVAVTSSSTTLYNSITDQNFFTALVNHPDVSRRWYPLPFVKNAMNERGDSVMEKFDDQTEEEVIQGARKWSGLIPKAAASPQLKGVLTSNNNQDIGMFEVDITNNLRGVDILDGFFYPIRMDQNSIVAIFNPGNNKQGMNIKVQFNIHVDEIDSNLNTISYLSMGSTVDLGNLTGLLYPTAPPSTFTNLAHASNDLTVALYTIYGDAAFPAQIHGMNLTNVTAYRTNNTPGSVTLSTVTEQVDANGVPNGVYVIVAGTAPSSGDIWQLTWTALGVDFTSINQTLVTFT